jgi:hypothetical protein
MRLIPYQDTQTGFAGGLIMFFALLCATSLTSADAGENPAWSAWVSKIEVERLDGTKEIGSGVNIGNERVVTNCHVIREASMIRVIQGGSIWQASMDAGDVYRDLCFLTVPGFNGKSPAVAEAENVTVGLASVAVGYSAGLFKISRGHVKGLFNCACDGGKVIQTSSQFDPGASGGGLFNDRGELIGILTFKSSVGGDYHFALPVGWMKLLSSRPLPSISGKTTFWESATRNSGYFLAACDLGAKKNWHGLLALSRDWIKEESSNPEAWMAWGRSNLRLGNLDDAVKGFQKTLLLDSTHAEAWWELQKLEIDLDKPLVTL